MSLLPSVIKVADRNGLEFDPRTIGKKEVRTKCPFCQADANRHNKFYMSLNESKNVFKCWYCKASGGVLRFISLLEDIPEHELIEKVRKKSGSTYQKHPAERLTSHQLRLLGYPNVDWVANRKFDVKFYKEFRERVFNEWQTYLKDQKESAYQILFVGLISGEFNRSIKKVKEMEQELQVECLDELLNRLFQESKDLKTFHLESRAAELVGRSHPYETFLL